MVQSKTPDRVKVRTNTKTNMIKSPLEISEQLSLPVDAVTNTFAILAMRRRGKTYTASVMAEEFYKAGLPFVALDPTGAWWGLRSSANGKDEGLRVVIIGGPHGDVPLEHTAGKVIADLVVDNPGFYVIDYSGFDSDEHEDIFSTDFALRLYRRKQANASPLHVFIDEADRFVPESPEKNQGKMLSAYNALVRRGGIYGIGVTLISQRPALIDKNVLSQCQTLFALQVVGEHDRNAVERWLKGHASKETLKEIMETVSSLRLGEAWVYSPAWLSIIKRVQIRERHTFNSSATPEVGKKIVAPKLASVDLEKLGERIQSTVKKLKENDPVALQATIRTLQAQIARGPVNVVATNVTPPKPIEVLILGPESTKLLTDIHTSLGVITANLQGVSNQHAAVSRMHTEVALAIGKTLANQKSVAAIQPATSFRQPSPQHNPYRAPVQMVATSAHAPINGDEKPSGGLYRIMVALAQEGKPMGRSKLGALAGIKSTTGSFRNYLSKGRVNGWISGSNAFSITDDGIAALGEYPHLPRGSELVDYWVEKLSGGAGKILKLLGENPGAFFARDAIAANLNISSETGSFRNYLSLLRTRDLIDEQQDGSIGLANSLCE